MSFECWYELVDSLLLREMGINVPTLLSRPGVSSSDLWTLYKNGATPSEILSRARYFFRSTA